MKPTDFGYHLSRYFRIYLPGKLGYSSNTIASYRDTFTQFLSYCSTQYEIQPGKLALSDLSPELVTNFLAFLEASGKNIATCNQRLAALKAFFKYLQTVAPEHLFALQRMISIRGKKQPKPAINYLTVDGMKLLLSQPDTTRDAGYRDLLLLTVLYDSAARVSELASIQIKDVRFSSPATIRLSGKGNKERIVPLSEKTAALISRYMSHTKLHRSTDDFLFLNHCGEKLTRAGISYILQKYAANAKAVSPDLIPDPLTPHCIRHSKAMHLLEAGVSIVYIRDFLGHEYLKTTEVYARADGKAKKEALAKAFSPTSGEAPPKKSWNDDEDLMNWLRNL